MFARLGAMGTAVAVDYFASISHALPYPVGLHEKLQRTSDQVNYQAEAVRVALDNNTLLTFAVKELFEQLSLNLPNAVSGLADEKMLRHSAATGQFPLGEWEAANALNVQRGLAADALVTKVAFRAGRLQALIVVIATMQWGFGDLFFGVAH